MASEQEIVRAMFEGGAAASPLPSSPAHVNGVPLDQFIKGGPAAEQALYNGSPPIQEEATLFPRTQMKSIFETLERRSIAPNIAANRAYEESVLLGQPSTFEEKITLNEQGLVRDEALKHLLEISGSAAGVG